MSRSRHRRSGSDDPRAVRASHSEWAVESRLHGPDADLDRILWTLARRVSGDDLRTVMSAWAGGLLGTPLSTRGQEQLAMRIAGTAHVLDELANIIRDLPEDEYPGWGASSDVWEAEADVVEHFARVDLDAFAAWRVAIAPLLEPAAVDELDDQERPGEHERMDWLDPPPQLRALTDAVLTAAPPSQGNRPTHTA